MSRSTSSHLPSRPSFIDATLFTSLVFFHNGVRRQTTRSSTCLACFTQPKAFLELSCEVGGHLQNYHFNPVFH